AAEAVMSERSGKRGEGEQKHGRDEDRSRFTGDGPGERGYRGSRADDVPPGDVPGGSYGGGGGRQQGGYSTSGPASRYGHADEFERGEWSGTEQGEWRTGYGAYGVGRDTSRRASWGRQSRDPGATFERRGGGWAAGEQPYQRGRGPRSYRTWTQEPWTRSEFRSEERRVGKSVEPGGGSSTTQTREVAAEQQTDRRKLA